MIAMCTLSILYNNVSCFSHDLDHLGEKMHIAILNNFLKTWIGIFTSSPKTRLLWQTQTHLHIPLYTRWWSNFEVFCQDHESFGDVITILSGNDLIKTSKKLARIISNPSSLRKLKIEPAITTDAVVPLLHSQM